MWGNILFNRADAMEAYLLEKSHPLPEPTASEALATHMTCAIAAYADREKVLRREIADREAELADVIRSARAAGKALDDLVDSGVDQAALEAEFTDLFSPKPDVVVAPRETTGPNMDKLAKELAQQGGKTDA